MGLLEVFEDIRSWLTGDTQRDIIQKTGGLGIYDVREIDLSVARTDEKIIFDGDSICIAHIDNQAYIKLNDVRNKPIDIMKVRLIRTPFNEYFITNEASSGTIYLLVGSKGIFAGLTRPFLDVDDIEDAVIDAMKEITGNVLTYSDDLLKSNNAEVYVDTTGSGVYEKVKTIAIPDGVNFSNFRCKWDMKTTDLGNPAKGRVYKNGVLFGATQSVDSLTYVNVSDDVPGYYRSGDTLELWLNQGWGGERAYARNFRVYGDIDVANIPPAVVIIDRETW